MRETKNLACFVSEKTVENILRNEPARETLVLIALASSESSDEIAHTRSLVRVPASRIHKIWK